MTDPRTVNQMMTRTALGLIVSAVVAASAACSSTAPATTANIEKPRLPIRVSGHAESASSGCPDDLAQFRADLLRAGISAQAASYVLYAVSEDCAEAAR